MTKRPLLPLPDYQRIYQVIYSVLEASGIATTHRACLFFAAAGTMILREHYKLAATISAGSMALMVDEGRANVVMYGRDMDGTYVSDDEAFHAWTECNGWLIDFMSPIMNVAMREDGYAWKIPRHMLQKRLSEAKHSPHEIQHLGEFYIRGNRSLAESLIESQTVQSEDLLNVCLTWFQKPPKKLKELVLGDSHGSPKRLTLAAPSIEGVW